MKLKPIKSNMTEIEVDNATVMFSYSTPVAAHIDGEFYRTEQEHSVTTSRHINQWLDGAITDVVIVKPQGWFDNLLSVTAHFGR